MLSDTFSSQVLSKALKVWNLELLPLQSKAAQQAQQCPQYVLEKPLKIFGITKFLS